MKALIVEDDTANRHLLGIYLKPFATCDAAEGGMEALRLFEQAVRSQVFYDVVCLDIMMPDIDGVSVLKRLREIESENGIFGVSSAKVLMMTAVADKEIVKNAFREGCEGYVIKPLQQEEIVRQLKALQLIK